MGRFEALQYIAFRRGVCLLTRGGVEEDRSGVAVAVRELERPTHAVPSRVGPRKALGNILLRWPVGIR